MKSSLLFLLLLCGSVICQGQDPTRFAEELSKFKNDQGQVDAKDLILFTGSSSIRLWVEFDSYFPNHNVINRGFGGSETSDLIHYVNELVLKYQPKQVFIYEGDNDINSGEKPNAIIKEMKSLLSTIQNELPGVEIVLISAKPSISRLHLKKKYLNLNKKLEKLAKKTDGVSYVSIWEVMFDAEGQLIEDIFIEDGLHMNRQGYDIWIKKIAPLLRSQ